MKNIVREKQNLHKEEFFLDDTRAGVDFDLCSGSLNDNRSTLSAKMALTTDLTKRANLSGVMKVSEYIESNGQIISTQDQAGKMFQSEKQRYLGTSGQQCRATSASFF